MMNINGKETLWIDRGWRTGDIDKDSGLSGMKLLENSQMSSSQGNYTDCATDYAEVDPRNMSTFYNCRKSPENPTPYATTMLINSMPQEMCGGNGLNPPHSHSEHEICAGGSSGTSSLHSDGKYCIHPKHYGPGENFFRVCERFLISLYACSELCAIFIATHILGEGKSFVQRDRRVRILLMNLIFPISLSYSLLHAAPTNWIDFLPPPPPTHPPGKYR